MALKLGIVRHDFITRDSISARIRLILSYLNIVGDTELIRMNAGSSNGNNFHCSSILGHDVASPAMAFVVTWPLTGTQGSSKRHQLLCNCDTGIRVYDLAVGKGGEPQ